MAAPAQEYASLIDLLSPQDPRKKLALAQAMQGTDTSPVQHWTQGAARALNAALGGYDIGSLELEKKLQAQNQINYAKANPLVGGSGVPSPPLEAPSFVSKLASLLGGVGGGGVTQQPVGGQPPMGGVIGQPQQPAGEPQPPPPPPVQGRPSPLPPAPSGPMVDLPDVPAATGRGNFAPNNPKWVGTQEGEANGMYPTAAPANKVVAALGSQPPPITASPSELQVGKMLLSQGQGYPIGPEKLAQAMRAQPQPPPLAPGPPLPPDLGAPSPAPSPAVPPAPGTSIIPPPPEPTIPAAMKGYIRSGLNPDNFALAMKQMDRYAKPNEYDYHRLPNGDFAATNKHNPNDVRIIKGDSAALVRFEGEKKEAETAGEKRASLAPGVLAGEEEKKYRETRGEKQAALDVAKPLQDRIRREGANVVVDDIDRALTSIKGEGAFSPRTGLTGTAAGHVPGTKAHDLGKLITGIQANTSFDQITQMRQASPTGAALGSITDKEHALLMSARGSVEQSQSAEQLSENLRRLKNISLDIIHGPGQGPAREKLDYKSQGDTGGGNTTKSGIKWSIQ